MPIKNNQIYFFINARRRLEEAESTDSRRNQIPERTNKI